MEEPPQVSSLEQLLSLIKLPSEAVDEALKPENLHYALYARKSTTDEGRQEKSKSDQIADCFERVVKPDNITLGKADIIEEDGSAKEPDIRPKFRKLLDDIIAGKYDGIICWHPDRLARNMKEAGEIIDLVDKGIIKDLRFATFSFENSPTGKMLLGISFVLSKQFSEHLSEQVTRGNRRKTEDGRYLGTFKHGYIKTEDGRLYPDGENFNIIRQAFEMRMEGQLQADIMRYLNGRKDYRIFIRKAGAHKPYKWDKDSVSSLLSDPVYAGVLRYGASAVNLVEVYDFTPVISAEDFLKINQAKDFMSAKFKSSIVAPKAGVKANLLRGIVFCGHCGKDLSSGITVKNNAAYYRYRCETDGCPMKNKGPRAKIVTDYCIDFLDRVRFTTRANYENYAAEVEERKRVRQAELSRLTASLDKLIQQKRRAYDNAKIIAADPTNPLNPHYVKDLDGYVADLKELNKQHKLAKQEQVQLKAAIPTYENYLELFDNVAVILRKTRDINQMDKILRKFFSNLTLKAEFVQPKNVNTRWKMASHTLKEPYATFEQTNTFDTGRGERTRTSDLSDPNAAR